MISKRLVALGISNTPLEKIIEPSEGQLVGIELDYKEMYLGVLGHINSKYTNGKLYNQYEIIIEKKNIKDLHGSMRQGMGGKFKEGNILSLSLNNKKIYAIVENLEWKYPKDNAKLTVFERKY